MSAGTVLVIYRQSVEEELALDQFKEQACRQQLCMSHTLASNGSIGGANFAALHRHAGIQNGKTEIGELVREGHGIRVGSSPCKGFSMRSYVANVREANFSKCWPFRPHLLEKRLEENADALLPPLKFLTFRYWECSQCAKNDIHSDISVQRMDGKELDISKLDMPIKCSGNLLARLPHDEIFNYGDRQKAYLEIQSLDTLKEDGRDQTVEQHVSIDWRSGQPYFTHEKGIVHDKDDIVKTNAVELFKLQKTSLNLRASKGDHSLSVNETVACDAMLSHTDSDLASIATQNICNGGNDEAIVDREMNQIPNFAEKAKAFPEIMNTATLVNQVEKVSRKSHDDITVQKEVEQFIMETPANTALISTTVDNAHKQAHITHVLTSGENNGLLSNVNKCKDYRQRGKGRAMKKRLISDLIGDTPFELYRFNEVNWNHTIGHENRKVKFGIQRRNMIGKWKVSKAAVYNLRKFKGKIKYASKDFEKRHLESMDIKRKHCQLGVSYQYSASAKSMEETRRPVKRQFVSKTSEGPCNEVPSSQASIREVPAREHNFEHAPQTQTKTHSDQDDDLLIDLASFMAQNQFERNATLPSSISLQEKGCARAFVMEKKSLDAEDLKLDVTRKSKQSSDAILQHPIVSSKQHLNTEQNGSRCISINTSENDWEHLPVEDDHQQINQMEKSISLETPSISGQGKEAGLISKVQDVNVSGSIHACKITESVEKNLDKTGDGCSVSHIHNLADTAVMKRQNDKTLLTFQRRRPAVQKSIKQINELVKSSCNQVSLVETTDAAFNAALLNGKPSMPVFASTTIKNCDNALGGSLSNSCQTAVSAPAEMAATTCFALTQITPGAGLVPSQTLDRSDLSPTTQSRPPNSQVLAFACSDGKIHQSNQPGGCSTAEKTDRTPCAKYNQEVGVLQALVRERDVSGNHVVRSESRHDIVESLRGHVQEAKDWVTPKQGTCLEQPLSASTLPASCSFVPQLSASMKHLPVKYFPMESSSQHLLNSYRPPHFLSSVPPYFTMSASPSLDVAPMDRYSSCKDYTESLRSSLILSFAQGNKLDTETALSQESFAQGKFDLQAYIRGRIEVHHPSRVAEARAHKRSAAVDAEKGNQKRLKPRCSLCDKTKPNERLLGQVLTPENKKIQVANSWDSKVCTLNLNPAEVTGLGNGLPSKRKVGSCEKVVKLQIDADGQNQIAKSCLDDKAESQNTQPVTLPRFQIRIPDKSMDFISRKTLKSDKLKVTDELKNNLPANIPAVNRRKYSEKTGKEVTEGREKLEAPSSFIQHFLDLRAIENYIIHGKFCVTSSSQSLPPKEVEPVKLGAGGYHVLKPITQNTQQCYPIHSLVDQCGKFVNTLEKPPNSRSPTENDVHGARLGPTTIAIPESAGGIVLSTARCSGIELGTEEGCNRDQS